MNATKLQAPRQQYNGFDVQRVTPAIREQVAALRVLSGREQATPMSHRDIALMVGVSASTVGHLLRGTYDTHLQNTRIKMQARKAAAALAKKTQA
jgi:predicted transcriptional regulator